VFNLSAIADHWPSVAAADLVMVMPDGAAMTAVTAVVIASNTTHSSIVACAVHATSMIVAHLTMIHSILAP
jgi:hypothetical protein